VSGSPAHPIAIALQGAIGGDQAQPLEEGLGHQQAIEQESLLDPPHPQSGWVHLDIITPQ
jgi:hypothetical protein